MMSKVVAIIKPYALETTRERLLRAGINGLTISECKGFGRQKGHTELYRGAEYVIDFLPKIKLEVYSLEGQVSSIVAAIEASARSGRIGDGKVWIEPIELAVRIRTGEKDEDCLRQLIVEEPGRGAWPR